MKYFVLAEIEAKDKHYGPNMSDLFYIIGHKSETCGA